MFDAMTTEALVGMSLVIVAMFIMNTAAARMLGLPWNSFTNDEAVFKKTIPAVFLYKMSIAVSMVTVWCSALMLIFAAEPSDAEFLSNIARPEAETGFALASGLAICGAILSFMWVASKKKSLKQEWLKPMGVIATIYDAGFMFFVVATVVMSLIPGRMGIPSDYFVCGVLVLIGAVAASLFGLTYRNWMVKMLSAKNLNTDALMSGAKLQTMLMVVIISAPAVTSMVVITS